MITRKDVAKHAGVSLTAVSRAISGNGYLSKEKREAVMNSIKELGYQPTLTLASLQNRTTRQLLYYCKDINNLFHYEFYSGMMEYAKRYDYSVLLSGTMDFERIKTHLVDGIVLPNESAAFAYTKYVKNYNIPVICAAYGNVEKNPGKIPFVISDTYEAVELLIHHLWEKGHRKIALATPYHLYATQPKHIAYISMMRPVLGKELEQYVFSVHTGDLDPCIPENHFQDGEIIAKKIILRETDATAMICYNDVLAMSICGALRKHGVSIPEDLSMVSIDGIKMGKYFSPQLTTVSLSPAIQGQECVKGILDMINGDPVKSRTQLPVKLLEGDSVKTMKTCKNSSQSHSGDTSECRNKK